MPAPEDAVHVDARPGLLLLAVLALAGCAPGDASASGSRGAAAAGAVTAADRASSAPDRATPAHASDRPSRAPGVRSGLAPARLELPASASGPFGITDPASGVAIVVTPAADDATGVTLRALPDGVEDFVAFAARPAREELSYAVALESAAGLRWVGDVVELLDAAGAPRLRVAAPYVVDAAGWRHAAALAVEGCAADRDPRAPWGRAPAPPGATSCTLRVRWGEALAEGAPALDYPVVVDPSWETTGSMSAARYRHQATLLADGRVLVTGTISGIGPSAELYDPATGTWAVTGPLAVPRYEHAAVAIEGGLAVLVIGGRGPCGGCPALDSVERYDAATGELSLVAAMPGGPRVAHAAATLADGTVLVAGGRTAVDAPYTILATAELFDPQTDTFTAVAPLAHARMAATLTALADGTALAVGGEPGTKAAERFDPAMGWLDAGASAARRSAHAAVRLSDGRVVIVGGRDGTDPVETTEIFDPAAPPGGAWTISGDLLLGHLTGDAAWLPGDRVLEVGLVAGAELFDPQAGAWALTAPMPEALTRLTATSLPGGGVLVAGGATLDSVPSAEAFVFELSPLGAACTGDAECASSHCADGVCCDDACDGECRACSAAVKGGGADGTCELVAAGTPAPEECAATEGAPCGPTGLCSGDGKCELAPAGASCQSASCGEPGTCDGEGACVCVPACSADGLRFGGADCAPYVCRADVGCLTECSGSSDCAPPQLCDRTRHCVAPAEEAPPPGCGCRIEERPRAGPALVAALVALGLARRRRRG